METPNDSSGPAPELDPAVRAGIIIAAGDIGVQLAPARHKVAAHESAHVTAELGLGGDPAQFEAYACDRSGFLQRVRPSGAEERPDRTDDEQLAALDKVQAVCGLPPLDMRQIRRQARALLIEHWIFHASVAQILERRIAAGGEVWIRGDELSSMWFLYLRRKERTER